MPEFIIWHDLTLNNIMITDVMHSLLLQIIESIC